MKSYEYLTKMSRSVNNKVIFEPLSPYPAETIDPLNQNLSYLIRYIFFLAGCFLINTAIMAQVPVADFRASSVAGCATLTVAFTDQSSGNPKYWNWDFGNGQLSTQQNPAASYSTPGVYTVTLVVRNADGTDGETKTDYISVFPAPNASFTANLNTACTPALIQFTDISISGNPIVSYKWEFSDGTTSNLQNPTKLYTTTGYQGVSLTVTTANGCSSTNSSARFIRMINGITPNFDFNRVGACTFPVTATFINQTSGPGTLTHEWSFGDGNVSTLKDPSNSYATTGTYNVQLKTKSNYGCEGTVTKPISFGATNTQIGSVDNSCPNNPIIFSNVSTPAPLSSTWDFGDGTSSTQANPNKTYTTPGTYTVTLISKYPECEGTVTKNIVITAPPAVDFTSANPTGCTVPYTVNFQNTSPDAVSFLWNFGDGFTSTLQNPAHTYNRTGSFNVTLSILSSGGCASTITKNSFVNINTSLAISLQGVPKEGCAPLSFSPTAVVNTTEPISSYAWTFGDGGTSNLAAPTHIYASGGTYDVSLQVTTAGGCQGTITSVGAVKAGSLPSVDFSFSPSTEGCAGTTPISFTDLSSAPVDRWLWEFGDGETSTAQNPTHLFADTGSLIMVSLTAYNNGCKNVSSPKLMPRLKSPVAKFDPQVNCSLPASTRLTVDFIDKSLIDPLEYASTIYTWDFGDGTFSSTPGTNQHTYAVAGKYTVRLTLQGPAPNNCSYTYIRDIDLRPQIADFTIDDPTICPYQPFKIETVNVNPNEIKSYTWTIGSSPAFLGESTIDSSFSIKGTYDVTLNLVDTFGCISSKTIPALINITGAEADFTVVNNGGCAGSTITFTDLSTSPTTNSWKFDYGNGNIISYSAPPFTQVYPDSGSYTVFLYIQDTDGCRDTISKRNAVQITKNIANFGTEKTLFCPGGPLQFIDSSKGSNLSYTWDFGDGTTDNSSNPIHAYPAGDATYTVKLSISDPVGCSDAITRTNYIKIVGPKPRFDAEDTVSLCPPLLTTFNSTSRDYDSLYWSFGDGNTSTLDTATNFYNDYGTYIAKLYTVGYGGCLDSASATVRVLNPSVDAKIVYDLTQLCDSIDVRFELTIPDNIKFYLYFGDGQADSSRNLIINHKYRGANLYSPSLILKDALDCEAGVPTPGIIRVKGAIPLFGMDRKNFCDNGDVFFTQFDIGDPVLSRSWDFGDGTTTTNNNPSHFFSTPDTYIVTQSVLTESGCQNSFTDTVRVYRTPEVTITGENNVCLNDLLILKAGTSVPDTAITWKWTIAGNTSTDSVISINSSSVGQLNVSLDGTNKIGCSGTFSTQVTVNPLPEITMPPSVTTPVGFDVTIPVTYNDPDLTYEWKPATYLNCTDCAVPDIINPRFNTTYQVKVTDENNCVDKDTLQLITLCNNINYFIPNTFSPNGDGSNDWFYPRGVGLNRIQSIRIFNRWGELVFEKRNFAANSMTEGWNGTYKGKPAAADAYVYIMELICENSQIVPIKGNVTLVR